MSRFEQCTAWLTVVQSQAYAMNSGIIVSGDTAALIDPGVTPDETAAIAAFVRERGATVRTIFLTHSHWDHILGTGAFPDAAIITHRLYVPTAASEEHGLRAALAAWERDTGIVRATPLVIPQPTTTFDTSFAVTVGAETFALLHAPGHHPDMYVLYHPASATLWAADMLSDLEIPFVEYDCAAYQASLEMLDDLPIATLVPGHGAWTADAAEIRMRLRRDQEYLAALDAVVRTCRADGRTLAQTEECCQSMEFLRPDANAQAHLDNVGTVWLAYGGAGDPAMLGWNVYY